MSMRNEMKVCKVSVIMWLASMLLVAFIYSVNTGEINVALMAGITFTLLFIAALFESYMIDIGNDDMRVFRIIQVIIGVIIAVLTIVILSDASYLNITESANLAESIAAIAIALCGGLIISVLGSSAWVSAAWSIAQPCEY